MSSIRHLWADQNRAICMGLHEGCAILQSYGAAGPQYWPWGAMRRMRAWPICHRAEASGPSSPPLQETSIVCQALPTLLFTSGGQGLGSCQSSVASDNLRSATKHFVVVLFGFVLLLKGVWCRGRKIKRGGCSYTFAYWMNPRAFFSQSHKDIVNMH